MTKFSSAERQLRHLKGFRVKTGIGIPRPSEGSDGELTLRLTKSGLKLLCKFKNKWYGVGDQSLQEASGSDLDTPNPRAQGSTTINSRTGTLLMGGPIAMGGSRPRGGIQAWNARSSLPLSSPINTDGNETTGLRFKAVSDDAYFDNIHAILLSGKRLYFDGANGHSYITESADDTVKLLVGGDSIFEATEAALGNNFDFQDNVDVRLLGRTDSATAASTLQFDTQRGTSTTTCYGQDGDLIGKIIFQGRNDGASNIIDGSPVAQHVVFGRIQSTITDASDGTDTGLLEIDSSGNIELDAGGDVIIDAAGSDINFLVAGTGPRLNWNAVNGLSLYSSAELASYFNIQPHVNNGSVTFNTVDANGSGGAGDGTVTFDINERFTVDVHSGKFAAKVAGTEFSVTDSAYAGMILGYTRIANTDATATDPILSITGTMAVLQTANGQDLSITFKAPPSGNVEICLSAYFVSVSTTVAFALSDNSSFNEVNQIHTYDSGAYAMDETDRNTMGVRWAVTGLTAGTSYTYYIAGEEISGSSSYILHGNVGDGTNKHYPPIIIKAIALPGTITTGK